MRKFNFESLKGDIYNQIEHDSRLKNVDWSEFFNNEHFYIVTHNGQFHADDVFCVALIYILYVLSDRDTATGKLDMCGFMDEHLIREPSLDVAIKKHSHILSENTNTVVFDIAGGHYDHHCAKTQIPNMTKKDLDESNINLDYLRKYCLCDIEYDTVRDMDLTGFASAFDLCSFGQLWQHIGRGFNHKFANLPDWSKDHNDLQYIILLKYKLTDMSVFSKVFKEYALPISLVDLNGPKNWNSPISRIIANCNRDASFFAGGFGEAFSMAVSMLFGEINNAQSQCETLDDVYDKLIHSKPQLSDIEINRKVKGGGSELVYRSHRVKQLPLIRNKTFKEKDQACGAYVSEIFHGEHSYIVIPDGCDMNINLNTLEYIYVRNSDGRITNPLFIFNQNPAARDGAYRIVCGPKIVLNKGYIDAAGVKYKFCHEAGFMITFETIKDAQDFIDWLNSTSICIERIG